MAYDAGSWQNFYIMTGGAAAALTGLVFVAMSIHARAIIEHPLLGNRAVGTLISLLEQLAIAGAVLVPGQPTLALGIEVDAAAVFFLAFVGLSIAQRGQSLVSRSRLRAGLEGVGGSLWMVLFIASGVSLMLRAGGGFYLLAVVMLLMFSWNIYVAWSLISQIAD